MYNYTEEETNASMVYEKHPFIKLKATFDGMLIIGKILILWSSISLLFATLIVLVVGMVVSLERKECWGI